MCSSSSPPTTFAGGPIHIVGTPGAEPPLTPFAAVAYPTLDLGVQDRALFEALQAAIAEVKSLPGQLLGPNEKVAFSILCFTTTPGHHRYAGVGDGKMHFAASLLKVAAMYAAHELLAATNRLARTAGGHRASPTAFFQALVSKFDPLITAAAPGNALAAAQALATKLPAFRSLPSYEKIFEVTGTGGAGAPAVDFTADFKAQMKKMIEVSDNHGAGECIRRLSYSYINAALIKAGFIPSGKGIWLAGDYTGDTASPNPKATVDSENDGQAAQVSTAKQITRLFALVVLDKLVTQDGNNARMKTLLEQSAALGGWFHFAPLAPPASQPFELKLSKIGRGPRKAGGETFSEGQLLRWTGPDPTSKGLKREFVVCWENLNVARIRGIVEVFARTYAKLLV